ncbi:nucleoside-diphosphate-sugar epimerase [Microdochium bolleyi]|uniref:Nucleoside-diphosphate-sugar epimerase n=1 Tax=Microdochium bolleyi TaxID=196109 RepID=A0A136IUJ1_9PEZI|nr:nucleoside-diphosphate-sugar epimerase [Microdochium bolleyi]
MKVLITGAAGFVGQLTAAALLNDEQGRYDVILTDIVDPPVPSGVRWPAKATAVKADLLTQSADVVGDDLEVAFVFHGIMSSGAEADFDLGMSVNFDATRALLSTFRKTCPGRVRVIYTSSQAVYGGDAVALASPSHPSHRPVDESFRATPQTSYGCEKLMCEALINEHARRGFISPGGSYILRLPTVTVRPGKPTAAASSFISGIIREPMQGRECVVPLTDRSWRHWVTSPRMLVRNLLHAAFALGDTGAPGSLPAYDRALNLPGIGVNVQDMMDSLARVGGEDKLRFVKEEEDPVLRPILDSWPAVFDNTKTLAMGFERDSSFDEVVRDFQRWLGEQK